MKDCIRITVVGIAFTLAFSSVTSAAAPPSYSGAVTGVFDAPMLTGAFRGVGSRLPVACDNTSSAPGFGAATSNFTWGDLHGGSAVEFIGNSFDDVAPDQVFPLGTLRYFNGWNSPASLVFGLGMQLSAGDGITPFTGPVEIVSTQNGNVDRMADADALVFDTFETPSVLGSFEGTVLTAIVYGKIGGDAELQVMSIELAPGEAGNGCASGAPLVDSRPCACGDVCAAVTLALAGPLCGNEQLPAALRAQIDQALQLLSGGASKGSERKAKKEVRLAIKRLHKSAAIARGAARKGRISAECAKAVGSAVRNARSHAQPWLSAR